MHALKNPFAAVCIPLFAIAAGFAGAAEPTYPLNPAAQTLVVIRADKAKLFASLMQTRQARAFEVEKKDFSGKIQGVDVSVESMQRFLTSLADSDAKNVWYCLTQEGGSLARRTGGIGWDEPSFADTDAPERFEEFLSRIGLDLRGKNWQTEKLASGHTRIILTRDGTAEKLLLGGPGRAESWSGTLAEFLDRRDDMVGVLVNSRPLLGLLSLVTGVDFRSRLARFKLNVPASIQVELFNNADDLGFEARLNNFIPTLPRLTNPGRQTLLSFTPEPLLEVNFPTPELAREYLPFDIGMLALANINAFALVPQTVTLTVWRKNDDSLAWAAVCLVPDRHAFHTQLLRVYAWLDVLALAGPPMLELSEASAPSGHELRVVKANGITLASGMADGPGPSGYFIVSGAIDDWPNPSDIRKQTSTTDRVIQYRSFLDPTSRRGIADALASRSRRYGMEIAAPVWENALPEKDSGYFTVEGESLVLLSRNGLLPFLVPELAKTPFVSQ